jgi:DHA2 family multidrug resistance protein-like MFS transporter
MYGLKRIAEGARDWLPVAGIVLGIVVAVLFVQRQKKLADPLIDLHLLRSRTFSTALGLYLLAGLVSFGIYIFISQYLQLVLDLSPLEAGLWTLPWTFGFISGTLLVPAIVRRIDRSYVLSAGLVLAAIGYAVMTLADHGSGLYTIAVASLIFSIGLSPVFILTTDIVIGSAPPERAGAAAAISETSGELGGVLGIAIMGSIGTAVYRGAMSEAPESARGTLGGALALAETVRDPQLAQLARESFGQAMETVAIIAAVIVAGMAIAAFAILPRQQRTG